MAAATQLDIKNALLTNTKALGNSNRGLKEVVSDLLNQHGRNHVAEIEKGTFLSRATIYRLMDLTEAESGEPYRPQADTLERVLRYYGAEISFDQVSIDGRYLPKEK